MLPHAIVVVVFVADSAGRPYAVRMAGGISRFRFEDGRAGRLQGVSLLALAWREHCATSSPVWHFGLSPVPVFSFSSFSAAPV